MRCWLLDVRWLMCAIGSFPGTMRVPWCSTGKKSDPQTCPPAYGISGAITMNDGKFWLNVPNP